MKQGIFIGFILICLSFITTFYFNSMVFTSSGELSMEIYKEGEEIYSSPISSFNVVWVVEEDGENIVLEDDEISDYYGFTMEEIMAQKVTDDMWDVIYDVSGEDCEINMVYQLEGSISMYEANCRDRICVKTGSISRANQVLTCAPHRLVVKLVGSGDVDG